MDIFFSLLSYNNSVYYYLSDADLAFPLAQFTVWNILALNNTQLYIHGQLSDYVGKFSISGKIHFFEWELTCNIFENVSTKNWTWSTSACVTTHQSKCFDAFIEFFQWCNSSVVSSIQIGENNIEFLLSCSLVDGHSLDSVLCMALSIIIVSLNEK